VINIKSKEPYGYKPPSGYELRLFIRFPSYIICVLVVISLFLGLDNLIIGIYAQDASNKSDETTALSVPELGALVGLSGILSGVVVAMVNHKITVVRSKQERQFEILQNKVSIYQFIVYHLRIMINSPEFKSGTEKPDAISKTIHQIDSQLETKLFLLDPDSIHYWLLVRRDYKELWLPPPAGGSEKWKNFRNEVSELHSKLLYKFNHAIREEYQRIVGGEQMKEIPSEQFGWNMKMFGKDVVSLQEMVDHLDNAKPGQPISLEISKGSVSKKVESKIIGNGNNRAVQ
jgi:hypothetical protein